MVTDKILPYPSYRTSLQKLECQMDDFQFVFTEIQNPVSPKRANHPEIIGPLSLAAVLTETRVIH